jgi:hypothetical protein
VLHADEHMVREPLCEVLRLPAEDRDDADVHRDGRPALHWLPRRAADVGDACLCADDAVRRGRVHVHVHVAASTDAAVLVCLFIACLCFLLRVASCTALGVLTLHIAIAIALSLSLSLLSTHLPARTVSVSTSLSPPIRRLASELVNDG